MYDALVENKLILGDGVGKFEDAFLNGNGTITWLKTGALLIYFTNKISKTPELIKLGSFQKITVAIFRDKENKRFNQDTLNSTNERHKDTSPRNSEIIDSIIDNLK